MTKQVVSTRQAICVGTLFILGSTLITGGGHTAKQDDWITILIGAVISVPFLFIYGRILQLFPGKNLYEIVYELFGKIGGGIITALFSWYALHLGAMVLRSFTEFIQVVSLPKTPQIVMGICIAVACFWLLKDGLRTLGGFAVFCIPIIAVIVVASVLLSARDMDFANLKPMLAQSATTIVSQSITTAIFPFGEMVLLTTMLSSLQEKGKSYKVYYSSLALSGVVLVITVLRNTLLLGAEVVEKLYFPSYIAVSLINVRGFIAHIEILYAGLFLFVGIIKICVCIYACAKGVSKLAMLQSEKDVVIPITLLVLALSTFVFQNTVDMFSFLPIYSIYAVVFQAILPILIWIFAEVRSRSRRIEAQKAPTV